MSAAVGAFVLYVDGNGNGRFDIATDDASSPDQIIGGSHELMLVYLRDGSNLDFEKLRDKAGQIPSRGYALALTSQERWLPLDSVDLRLDDARFPYDVCSVNSITGGDVGFATPGADPGVGISGGGSGGSGGTTGTDTGGAWSSGNTTPPSTKHGPYPAANDPKLSCSPDGRSWAWDSCRGSPATPPGLCGSYHPVACVGYGASLGTTEAVPAGWPCNATPTPMTTTTADAGVDGGPFDAGH
jgi:hypothetical protein